MNAATRGAAPAILTERLNKSYGRSHARGVVDLDLEVRQGEVFGFLGPNGAGKTTTIRVLLDLIRPTSGRALVFGRDSRRDTLAFAYKPQQYMFCTYVIMIKPFCLFFCQDYYFSCAFCKPVKHNLFLQFKL